MPEQVLSPTDFEFTDAGELVVSSEQLKAALAQAGVEPGMKTQAGVEQGTKTPQGIKIGITVGWD